MQSIKLLFMVMLILIIILIIINLLIANAKKNYLKNRFKNFALDTQQENESFFDKLLKIIEKVIKTIGELFSYSKLIKFYTRNYDKYFLYKDTNYNKTDYFVIKIIILLASFVVSMLFFIFNIIDVSYLLLIFISVISFFVPNMFWEIKYQNKIKYIRSMLYHSINILVNGLNNGYSINKSIELVYLELDGSIGYEYKRIYNDLNIGLSLYESFDRFYKRVGIPELKFIKDTLKISNNVDLKLVFEYILREFTRKKNIDKYYKNSILKSVLLYRFISFILCSSFMYLLLFRLEYINVIFNSLFGIFMFLALTSLYVLYMVIFNMIKRCDYE